jgi:arginyl-tRNA synthetase
VQYAHARIASLLAKAGGGPAPPVELDAADARRLDADLARYDG